MDGFGAYLRIEAVPGRLIPAVLLCLGSALPAIAAGGCDLNYPDSDVPRLFPESTRYKTRYVNLTAEELARVLARLGERFRSLYDPLNVPYTVYDIYVGPTQVGYIHGVNQKGQFGGIQVFVALDMQGRVKSFYIQKMTGQWAAKLRAPAFGRQFIGLALKDFNSYDPATAKGTGRFAAIKNPVPEMETDFYAVLRALKKNLLVMDEIAYSAPRKNP